MLVLLSFALVLVATVLLVLGLLNDDGLTLIYISIFSSVAAAVVLIIALRLHKPRSQKNEETIGIDSRLGPYEPVAASVSEPDAQDAEASTAGAGASGDGEWLASDQDGWSADDGEEVDFPIADYDDLTVGQILPLLPQLYADEIDVVADRERSTKARSAVLGKLEELRLASASGSTGGSAAADPVADWRDTDDQWFPIDDYESLSAVQIRPLLAELDAEELALVRDRELGLGRRRSLLDEIDRRLGAPAGAKKAAPARKAPAKKAAPARKAPAKKAAPARKAPAKKAAPARKAPAKKAPAKKAPAKKAPAKKAPATKKR